MILYFPRSLPPIRRDHGPSRLLVLLQLQALLFAHPFSFLTCIHRSLKETSFHPTVLKCHPVSLLGSCQNSSPIHSPPPPLHPDSHSVLWSSCLRQSSEANTLTATLFLLVNSFPNCFCISYLLQALDSALGTLMETDPARPASMFTGSKCTAFFPYNVRGSPVVGLLPSSLLLNVLQVCFYLPPC